MNTIFSSFVLLDQSPLNHASKLPKYRQCFIYLFEQCTESCEYQLTFLPCQMEMSTQLFARGPLLKSFWQQTIFSLKLNISCVSKLFQLNQIAVMWHNFITIIKLMFRVAFHSREEWKKLNLVIAPKPFHLLAIERNWNQNFTQFYSMKKYVRM